MNRMLALVAASLMAMTALTAAEAKELRYNLFVPANTIEAKELDAFFKEVKEKTGGSLTGKVFPGGQLLTGPASLKGVGDGVADVGFVAPQFSPGELPHTNTMPDMVAFTVDPMATMSAANEVIMTQCPECTKEWADRNLVFLGGHTGTPWELMCTKPAATVGDLKGRKVRVPGGAATRLAEALGLVGVNMTPTEAAQGLAGGQIDCVVGATSWMRDYSFWDSAKSVINADLGLSAGLGTFVFNIKSWKGLSQKEQQVLMDLIPKYVTLMTQDYINREAEVRKQAEAKGVTFTKPDPTTAAAIAKYRKTDIPNIAAQLKKRGVKNPNRIIDAYNESLAKWKKYYDQHGRSPEVVAKAMREQIWAKTKLP